MGLVDRMECLVRLVLLIKKDVRSFPLGHNRIAFHQLRVTNAIPPSLNVPVFEQHFRQPLDFKSLRIIWGPVTYVN